MNAASQLLREWIETGSEEAFSRLVAQHVDLVYSVALRKAGGASGLASDVTQQVFTDLARKAGSLRTEGSLAGWLHRHTCLTAATALRSELRRRAREQSAAAMHALDALSDPGWQRLAPLLDDAVNSLPEKDRKAIVLRYYQDRGLREIGAELGVGEDGAQKRVARALDKLRGWLVARGVTSTTAAVAAALSAHSVSAAPAGLAAAVSSGALAATAVAAKGAGALALLELMTHTKIKIAAGTVLAAVIAAPVIWQEQAIASIQSDNEALALRMETWNREPREPVLQWTATLGNDGLDRLELERLRAEVSGLQRRLEQARAARLEAAARQPTTPDRPQPEGVRFSVRDARDVGAATPEALMETLFWAIRTGNPERFFELGDWSAEGAMKFAEEMRRELPAVATLFIGTEIQLQILRSVLLDNGDFAVVIERADPEAVDRTTTQIRRAGHEWRLVMDEDGPVEVDLGDELMRD